jgi:AbiEi antitoxin C-terminal domain
MAAVSAGIEDRKTDTGRMKISSVELTVLDLVRYPHAAGGLDNIATIIADLGERIEARKLAALSSAFERSVTQRLGYLMERFGDADRAETLHKALPQGSALPWVELERSQSPDMDLSPELKERNERRHVIVRRIPERDE